jgi:C4-dicarboxylate-specific signal transduction histidine kinase
MIAQDMQGTASSLLYNAAFLASQTHASDPTSHDEAREDILTMTRAMTSFLGRLSDLVRLGEAARETVSLESLAVGARRVALRRNERCSVSIPGGFGHDVYIQTNPILARQALAEILVNASEASDNGPIRLNHERILVNDQPLVRIRVEDEGRGIAGDMESKVFSPFFTTQPERNGLGLTVAREAARTLGGELLLERAANPTIFALLLPGVPRALEHGAL